MKKSSSFIKSSVILLTVALLPGCGVFDFFKKKSEDAVDASTKGAGADIVLCKINEKTVITKDDFDKRINQILQANPYFKGAGADMLPPQVKQNIFKRLVEEELLLHDADANSIEKDAEFKKIYSEMKNLLKRSVKIQLTEKKIFDKIQILDEEIKEHFDKNKERYVKVAGGALVSGVKFDTDAAANTFLTLAKAKIDQFDALGKKDKAGKFREFGRVSNEAAPGMGGMEMVPAPIKEAVLAMSNLPAVQKVKVGKEVWIVKASDKKNPVYFELDEIKPQVAGQMKNERYRDEYSKVVQALHGKHKVSTNDEYFKAEAKPEAVNTSEAPAAAEEGAKTEEPASEGEKEEEEAPATAA